MTISSIFMIAMTVLIQTLVITIIIIKSLDKKDNILIRKIFIFNIIYLAFVSIFVPNELRFLLFFISLLICLYYILQIRDRKFIIYAFIQIILFAISEVVVSLTLVLLGFNSTHLINNNLINFAANFLISILAIILIYIPFVKNILLKLVKLFDKDTKLSKYLYILIFILYLIILKNGLEFLLKQNYYVNILFIVGIVIILTMIIKSEFKTQKINDENKLMLNYVTKYEKIITEQGKANHEFKNQLMVIRGYAQMNSKKLIEYIDSIVYDSKKIQSSYLISQLNNFPEGGIKGLLYYKISIMDDEKIKYELDVETGVKTKLNNLSVEMYKNITKILGVLLDNAIDASKKSKDKKINISVSKDKLCVIFVISNTYNGKIDLTKIGTGYSNKGNNHGYGLRLVKDIIEEQNSAFNLETSCEEKLYSTKLTIKINNKKRKSK